MRTEKSPPPHAPPTFFDFTLKAEALTSAKSWRRAVRGEARGVVLRWKDRQTGNVCLSGGGVEGFGEMGGWGGCIENERKKKGEERDTLDVPACSLGWLSDRERDFVYFCSAPR